MKLFCDANIMTVTVNFLRAHGYDVSSAAEVGINSEPDDEIFAYAQNAQRTILTHNADFTDLRKLEEIHHYGVIRLRITNQRAHYLHPILGTALKKLAALALKNMLVTITDKRVRIRSTSSI